MNKTLYRLVSSYGGRDKDVAKNLEDAVNDLIGEGYELYGSPIVYGACVCQAMIKPAAE